jgi:hypothetical protein
MAKIDSKTMTFIDLTVEEQKDLRQLARDIGYLGKVNWKHPLLIQWMNYFGYSPDQQLLVVTTVFPFRALDSVLKIGEDLKIRPLTIDKELINQLPNEDNDDQKMNLTCHCECHSGSSLIHVSGEKCNCL